MACDAPRQLMILLALSNMMIAWSGAWSHRSCRSRSGRSGSRSSGALAVALLGFIGSSSEGPNQNVHGGLAGVAVLLCCGCVDDRPELGRHRVGRSPARPAALTDKFAEEVSAPLASANALKRRL